jgi:hypothetical protein
MLLAHQTPRPSLKSLGWDIVTLHPLLLSAFISFSYFSFFVVVA